MARTIWKRKGVVSLGSENFRAKIGKLSSLSEYHSWRSMLTRCYRRKTINYYLYGGRGIKVNSEWFNFETFYNDMGHKPSIKHSIERIDSNANYGKKNCIWATRKAQNNNKRNNHFLELNGTKHTLSEWSAITGVSQNTLLYRKLRGRTDEEALRGITAFSQKKERRERLCLTCGKTFFPRSYQLKIGNGKYCSQKCNISLSKTRYITSKTPQYTEEE